MNNGQHASSRDPFLEGITAGVGVSPESLNQPANENLNTGNFEDGNPDNLNERGSSTLDAMSVRPDDVELTMPPMEQSAPQLGQVVDLVTPPQRTSSAVPDTQLPSSEGDTSIDPTIAHHLADGKVDKNDVGYLKSKTEDLINDPAKLAEFIMTARRTITNRLPGDSK
jgi:hypothetical protein